MTDDVEFRKAAEAALDGLLKHLIASEDEGDAGFEVEGGQGGLVSVLFEEPRGKFVITPNAPVQQIWISALSTSFKLDWDAAAGAFVLPRTGEQMTQLIDRLISEHLTA